MDVKEHFYHDDPALGPPDVRTNLQGVDYFFLGNGHIQAAIQVCPAPGATPLGLLIMSPDRLGPKRAALTFNKETGLLPTMVEIRAGDHTYQPSTETLDATWADVNGLPAVSAQWSAADLTIEELFYCPDRDRPRIVREITLRGENHQDDRPIVATGSADNPIQRAVAMRNGSTEPIALEYVIYQRKTDLLVRADWCDRAIASPQAIAAWKRLACCHCDCEVLDHLFTSAKNQLTAVLGADGTMDGSIWQYNVEWVRDQAAVVASLVMLGETALARTMICRLLADFVTDEGDTVDSGRTRPTQEIELDQNGELLWALKMYVDWTGDTSILHENWEKIHAAAEFPLRAVFRHEPSGLLHNCREYWERHALHGIQDGMELTNQLFVSIGLSSAAGLAQMVGRNREAKRWSQEAERLKNAMLGDKNFSLIDNGRFIKRRGLAGDVQREISVPEGIDLPAEIPLLQDDRHLINPDVSSVLPVAMEFIDPHGDLARHTLADVEMLWNQRWEGGGYGRYHISSEPDSPGPWAFPTVFAARAYLEAGDDEKVWRILNWLHGDRVPGRKAGTFFEFYGPRPVPPYPQIGIPPWTWAEILMFFIHHLLGVRPDLHGLLIRPRLLAGLNRINACLPLGDHNLHLTIERATRGETPAFHVDGRTHPYSEAGLHLARPAADLAVNALLPT